MKIKILLNEWRRKIIRKEPFGSGNSGKKSFSKSTFIGSNIEYRFELTNNM